MHICNTQYLFFKKCTLKISTNYPNAGIHTVFPLVSGNGYLFWHVTVWRKMSSHDTSVDCSCWWLLQVHLNVLSQMCVMLPALGLYCSVYLVDGYMLLHLTVLLPNLCETVTTLPNICQISLRNLQEIHLASSDIQHSHVTSTFNKLKGHEFLTAHWSIADFFRLEKQSFKEK